MMLAYPLQISKVGGDSANGLGTCVRKSPKLVTKAGKNSFYLMKRRFAMIERAVCSLLQNMRFTT